MNPTNTFFIGNSGIVQLDDVLISMAGARKNPGGDEPSPEPGPDDPITEVKVTLAVTGNVVVASAEGDTSTLSGYEFSIGSEKTVETGTEGKIDFAELGLEYGEYVVTAVAVSSKGGRSVQSAEEIVCYLPEPAAMTLRFEFSKKDYNPETAGVGSAGTWKKVDSPTLNIWDWTNEATDWREAFMGAFTDEDNEVSVIAAGDTSSVTDFSGIFSGLATGNPVGNSYVRTARNNIVSCVPFDISSATTLNSAFCCTSLRHFVEFDFSTNVDGPLFATGFADSYIEEIGDIYLGVKSAQGIFSLCTKLKHVGNITFDGTKYLNNKDINIFSIGSNYRSETSLEKIGSITGVGNARSFDTLVQNCAKLKSCGKLECGNMAQFQAVFTNCYELEHIPELEGFGTVPVTNVYQIFSACLKVKEIPLLDTSSVSNFKAACRGCKEIETIPDFDVSSVTNCEQAFRDCIKAKYGILEMYNKLLARGAAITNHIDCFKDCGIDTEEGRAALEQIPVSWGGLYDPNTVTIGGRKYRTTTIGNQVWMAENLDYKFDGCLIGEENVDSNPAACYFDNDETTYGVNGKKYGLLYNEDAMLYLEEHLSSLGIPDGWHVPSQSEIETLVETAGGEELAGPRLRATTEWKHADGIVNTDEYSFSLLPGGAKWSENFTEDGESAYFWSTTIDDLDGTYYLFATEYYGGADHDWYNGSYRGFSIRLVKDM